MHPHECWLTPLKQIPWKTSTSGAGDDPEDAKSSLQRRVAVARWTLGSGFRGHQSPGFTKIPRFLENVQGNPEDFIF